MQHDIVCTVNDTVYEFWVKFKKDGNFKNNGRALEALLLQRTVMHIDKRPVEQGVGRPPKYIHVER